MLKRIKTIFTRSKKSLFTFNNEPFSKFSILLVVLLDVFLLVTILNGINSEKQMSPSVSIEYPPSCQTHFKDIYKSPSWRSGQPGYVEKESFPFNSYDAFYENRLYNFSNSFKDLSSDVCIELDKKITKFAGSPEFKKNKELLYKLNNKKRNTLSDINRIEKRYNTSLFEKAAEIGGSQFESEKRKYYSSLEKERAIDAQIERIKKVSEYDGYDEYVSFVKENCKYKNNK